MGSPCSTNATKFTIQKAGEVINKNDVNEVHSHIVNEETRRGITHTTFTTKSTGNIINANDLLVLKNAITTCLKSTGSSYNWTENIASNIVIKASNINEMYSALNKAEVQCVCDCNYCTCNCNYCTCDCNHSCTCDCNYSSDRRLKTEITYF